MPPAITAYKRILGILVIGKLFTFGVNGCMINPSPTSQIAPAGKPLSAIL